MIPQTCYDHGTFAFKMVVSVSARLVDEAKSYAGVQSWVRFVLNPFANTQYFQVDLPTLVLASL